MSGIMLFALGVMCLSVVNLIVLGHQEQARRFAGTTLVGGAMLFILGMVFPASAQDPTPPPLPPEPYTVFTVDCYTVEDEGFTVQFGYTTNTPARWVGSGYDFVTEVGEHPTALSIYGEGYPPDYPVLGLAEWGEDNSLYPGFTAGPVSEVVYISFDLSTLYECGSEPPVAVMPLPSPTAPVCPAWSIDAATGLLICLWDLPYIGEYQ